MFKLFTKRMVHHRILTIQLKHPGFTTHPLLEITKFIRRDRTVQYLLHQLMIRFLHPGLRDAS
jgi:hypothetical protein